MLLPAVVGVLVHRAVVAGIHVAVVPHHRIVLVRIGDKTTAAGSVLAGLRIAGNARFGRADAAGLRVVARRLAAGGIVAGVGVAGHAAARGALAPGRRIGERALAARRIVAGIGIERPTAAALVARPGGRVVAGAGGAAPFGAGPGVPALGVGHGALAPAAVEIGLVHVDVVPVVRPAPPIRAPVRRRRPPERARGEAEGKALGHADAKAGAVAIGGRVAVVDRAHIGRIDIAGAVHDRAVGADHHAHIARGVAHHHGLRRDRVDAHVGHVVDRRSRRDGVDRRRHLGGHMPRAGRRRRREPDAVGDRVVVAAVDLDHRRAAVDRVAERGAGDRREARRAVILHRQAGLAARHRGGLRDGRGDLGLTCLRRAGHRDQHIGLGVGRRDSGEVCRQLAAGHVLPRPGQHRRAEPAARDQHVILVGTRIDKDRVVGIGHRQQADAADRRHLRRAAGHDQLGRLRGKENRRRPGRPLAVGRQHRIGLHAGRRLGGRALQRLGHGRHHFPGAAGRFGAIPVAGRLQVQLAAGFAQQQRSAVQRPFVLRARHGAPGRLAVDQHQQCRRGGKKDLGHVVAHRPAASLGQLLRYRVAGLQLVQRHRQPVGRQARHQRLAHPVGGVGPGRHFDAVHRDSGQLHQP